MTKSRSILTVAGSLAALSYQRAKAHVTEVKSSHVPFLSQPRAVAKVIEEAARNTE
jgi:hypothetical protein